MKIKAEIDPATNPNLAGEVLRNMFFAQDERSYGCYSNFELREGICKLEPYYDKWKEEWVQASNTDGITMRYRWDGDGCVKFLLPDGGLLVNYDCKKDSNWQFKKAR
jgi:hypothetical protein